MFDRLLNTPLDMLLSSEMDFRRKPVRDCLKWRFRVDIFSKQKTRNENFTSFGKVDIHIIKFFFKSLTIYLSLTNISIKNDVYRGE